MDLNKVMIIGRLTQDPEAKTTPQGVPVTSFSVATNRTWKDQQGNQQSVVEYHNIVAWRRLAEICAQYMAKGRQVYVEGHLQTRSWDDKNSGQKRYRTEIVADNVILLGSKNDSGASAPGAQANNYNGQNNNAPQTQPSQPQQEPAMAMGTPASDEEIRIEDIPF